MLVRTESGPIEESDLAEGARRLRTTSTGRGSGSRNWRAEVLDSRWPSVAPPQLHRPRSGWIDDDHHLFLEGDPVGFLDTALHLARDANDLMGGGATLVHNIVGVMGVHPGAAVTD